MSFPMAVHSIVDFDILTAIQFDFYDVWFYSNELHRRPSLPEHNIDPTLTQRGALCHIRYILLRQRILLNTPVTVSMNFPPSSSRAYALDSECDHIYRKRGRWVQCCDFKIQSARSYKLQSTVLYFIIMVPLATSRRVCRCVSLSLALRIQQTT